MGYLSLDEIAKQLGTSKTNLKRDFSDKEQKRTNF